MVGNNKASDMNDVASQERMRRIIAASCLKPTESELKKQTLLMWIWYRCNMRLLALALLLLLFSVCVVRFYLFVCVRCWNVFMMNPTGRDDIVSRVFIDMSKEDFYIFQRVITIPCVIALVICAVLLAHEFQNLCEDSRDGIYLIPTLIDMLGLIFWRSLIVGEKWGTLRDTLFRYVDHTGLGTLLACLWVFELCIHIRCITRRPLQSIKHAQLLFTGQFVLLRVCALFAIFCSVVLSVNVLSEPSDQKDWNPAAHPPAGSGWFGVVWSVFGFEPTSS